MFALVDIRGFAIYKPAYKMPPKEAPSTISCSELSGWALPNLSGESVEAFDCVAKD
jgi:hypothetical protein